MTCNLNNQAQIAFNHAPTRTLVTALREAREVDFLFRAQQRRVADLAEINACSVQQCRRDFRSLRGLRFLGRLWTGSFRPPLFEESLRTTLIHRHGLFVLVHGGLLVETSVPCRQPAPFMGNFQVVLKKPVNFALFVSFFFHGGGGGGGRGGGAGRPAGRGGGGGAAAPGPGGPGAAREGPAI